MIGGDRSCCVVAAIPSNYSYPKSVAVARIEPDGTQRWASADIPVSELEAEKIAYLVEGVDVVVGMHIEEDSRLAYRSCAGRGVVKWRFTRAVDVGSMAVGYAHALRQRGVFSSARSGMEPPYDPESASRLIGVDPTRYDAHLTAAGRARWTIALWTRIVDLNRTDT